MAESAVFIRLAVRDADKAIAELQKVGVAAEGAFTKMETSSGQAVRSSATLERELQRLEQRLDPAARQAAQLARAQQLLNEAQTQGVRSSQELTRLQALVTQHYSQNRQAAEGAAASMMAHAQASRLSYEQQQVLRSGLVNTFQSIIAGQPVMTTLITQLTQTAPAFIAVGAAAVVTGAAVAALAGVVAVGVSRLESNERALNGATTAMRATGTAAAGTRVELAQLVDQVAALPTVTRSSAQEMVTSLARVRQIGGELRAELAKLAPDVAAALGEDPVQAAQRLAKAFADPVRGAKELDEQFGILRVGEAELIAGMDRAGDRLGAQQLLYQRMTERMRGLARDGLTPMQAATDSLGHSWDRMLESLSRTSVVQAARDAVVAMLNGIAGATGGSGPADRMSTRGRMIQQLEAEVAEMRGLGARDDGPELRSRLANLARLRQQQESDQAAMRSTAAATAAAGVTTAGADEQQRIRDRALAAEELRREYDQTDVVALRLQHDIDLLNQVLEEQLVLTGRQSVALQQLREVREAASGALRTPHAAAMEELEDEATIARARPRDRDAVRARVTAARQRQRDTAAQASGAQRGTPRELEDEERARIRNAGIARVTASRDALDAVDREAKAQLELATAYGQGAEAIARQTALSQAWQAAESGQTVHERQLAAAIAARAVATELAAVAQKNRGLDLDIEAAKNLAAAELAGAEAVQEATRANDVARQAEDLRGKAKAALTTAEASGNAQRTADARAAVAATEAEIAALDEKSRALLTIQQQAARDRALRAAQEDRAIAGMELGAAGIVDPQAKRAAELGIERQKEINKLTKEFGDINLEAAQKRLQLFDDTQADREAARTASAIADVERQIIVNTKLGDAIQVSGREYRVLNQQLQLMAQNANLSAEEARKLAERLDDSATALRQAQEASDWTQAVLVQPINSALSNIQSSMASTFKSALQGNVKSWRDAWKAMENIGLDVVSNIASALVTKGVVGLFTKAFGDTLAKADWWDKLFSSAFAEGGLVTGPGGPRDDVIPARLSAGEFVVNADATARNLELLTALNEGRSLAETLAGFGRGRDTMVGHLTLSEVLLLRQRGGKGTTNPLSGLIELEDNGPGQGDVGGGGTSSGGGGTTGGGGATGGGGVDPDTGDVTGSPNASTTAGGVPGGVDPETGDVVGTPNSPTGRTADFSIDTPFGTIEFDIADIVSTVVGLAVTAVAGPLAGAIAGAIAGIAAGKDIGAAIGGALGGLAGGVVGGAIAGQIGSTIGGIAGARGGAAAGRNADIGTIDFGAVSVDRSLESNPTDVGESIARQVDAVTDALERVGRVTDEEAARLLVLSEKWRLAIREMDPFRSELDKIADSARHSGDELREKLNKAITDAGAEGFGDYAKSEAIAMLTANAAMDLVDPPTASDVEKRVQTLRSTFTELGKTLSALTGNADDANKANEGLARSIESLRIVTNESIAQELNSARGEEFRNQISDVLDSFTQQMSDATLLNSGLDADFATLVASGSDVGPTGTRVNTDQIASLRDARIASIVDGLSDDQLKTLKTEAEAAGDQVAVVNAVMAELQDRAREAADAEQKLADERSRALQLEALDAFTGRLNDTAQAARNAASNLERLRDSADQLAQSILLDSNLSPLSPGERLAEARSQLADARRRAALGDVGAGDEVLRLVPQLLEISKLVQGATEGYFADFQDGRAAIGDVKSVAERQLTVQQEIADAAERQISEIQKVRETLQVNSTPGSPAVQPGRTLTQAQNQALGRLIGFTDEYGGGRYDSYLRADPSRFETLFARGRDVLSPLAQADLEQIYRGVRGFADGGMFAGGLHIVGERGRELRAGGPARFWSAEQTQEMLGGGPRVVAAIDRLGRRIDQVTDAIGELRAQQGDETRLLARATQPRVVVGGRAA